MIYVLVQSLHIFIQNPLNGPFLHMQTNQSQTQLRCPSGFYNVHIYNVSTVYNVHNLGSEHRAVACADLSFADDLSHRRKPNALSQHREVINIGPTQSIQWSAKTPPLFSGEMNILRILLYQKWFLYFWSLIILYYSKHSLAPMQNFMT